MGVKAVIKEDLNWKQRGERIGRGVWRFYNGRPCAECGSAALIEVGGVGIAGSGVRACVGCRKK